ncbi:MAG: DUF2189 domain-containing protein [Hyphomicrobiaceae bacterium]
MSTSTVGAGTQTMQNAAGRTYRVKSVSFDAPWEWLAAGWRDLWTTPAASLSYGAAFAVLMGLILYGLSVSSWYALVLALAGGLLILAPLLALGLYEISRRRGLGLPTTLGEALAVKPAAPLQLAYIGFALVFLFGSWLRIAFMLFAIFFGAMTLPPIERFVPELLFTSHGLGMLIVGTIVGGGLAALAFMISAFSVPHLMVSQSDALSAMGLSARAVVENPRAMALWAVLIVGVMACGMATMLVGLVFAFPLVGHATWHAYKAVIEEE